MASHEHCGLAEELRTADAQSIATEVRAAARELVRRSERS